MPEQGLEVVPPPWRLTGTAVAMLACIRPFGVGLLALVHYDTSPVGPYDELARIRFTRRGPAVVQMLVNSAASREGGRGWWGFPKELAALSWERRGSSLTFRSEVQVWRLRAFGPSFPLNCSAWTMQVLDGVPVRVPIQVRGRIRIAFSAKQFCCWVDDLEAHIEPPVVSLQWCLDQNL